MKAAETLIAWSGDDADRVTREAPPGSVAVGKLLTDNTPDWSRAYHCTGGAANVFRRKLFGMPQRFYVLWEWYLLVNCYRIHPYVAHRAFLLIDEYQAVIKEAGWGPDRGELGHDPDVGYGACIAGDVPEVVMKEFWHSMHVWPTGRIVPRREKSHG